VFANAFKPAKIAGRILEATKRHRGRNSRSSRFSACFSERASPASSLCDPCGDLANLPLVAFDVRGDRFCARNDFERLVLRANASSFALNAALILAVMTVVLSAVLMPLL